MSFVFCFVLVFFGQYKLQPAGSQVYCYKNNSIASYLPLLPVLEVLDGRAGVWALDRPVDRKQMENR